MGYNTIFDVIGSIIIAGMVALIGIRANASIAKMTYTYGNEMTVQKNMTTIVRLVENDLRKIAYCAEPDSFLMQPWTIRSAGQNNITFLADIDFDTKMDTIKYYVGSNSDLSYTSNPRDFPLFRRINSQTPVPLNIGLTQFQFLFYDWLGNEKSFPILTDSTSMAGSATGIGAIRLTIMLESQYAWDSLYAYSYWRQLRLSARNLQNR